MSSPRTLDHHMRYASVDGYMKNLTISGSASTALGPHHDGDAHYTFGAEPSIARANPETSDKM